MGEFNPVNLDDVPLENLRSVVTLLFKHLGLKLEASEGFWGIEYRIVPPPPAEGGK